MNTKHTVNAPAVSGHRSMLRRFVTVATMGALMLGVASASAGGTVDKGAFEVNTHAGVGAEYSGKLAVKGDGKFSVKDEGGTIVFMSAITDGELNMKEGRQDHTVGPKNKLGIPKGQKVSLTIDKGKLTFPDAGKTTSGTVSGRLRFLGKESTVPVKYTVKEDGGKYVVTSASFEFKYTDHRPALSEDDMKDIREDAVDEFPKDKKKQDEDSDIDLHSDSTPRTES